MSLWGKPAGGAADTVSSSSDDDSMEEAVGHGDDDYVGTAKANDDEDEEDDEDDEDEEDDDNGTRSRTKKSNKKKRMTLSEKRTAAVDLAHIFLANGFRDINTNHHHVDLDAFLEHRRIAVEEFATPKEQQEQKRFRFLFDSFSNWKFPDLCTFPARFTAHVSPRLTYLKYLMPADMDRDVREWDGGTGRDIYAEVPAPKSMEKGFSKPLHDRFDALFSDCQQEYKELVTTKKKQKKPMPAMYNWDLFIRHQRFLKLQCNRIRYCCRGKHGRNEIEYLAIQLLNMCFGKTTFMNVTKAAITIIHKHYFPDVHANLEANKGRQ